MRVYHISTLLKKGWSQKEIANSIGVNPSTICREIQRNKDMVTQEYHYSFSETKSQRSQQDKAKYTVFISKIKTYIKSKLKKDWSPEQIAGRMKKEVTQALITMLQPLKDITQTITSDNGKEFAYHTQVSEALETDFYFAHPYSSWERGLNEHTNGLIRQYLPKKTDFTQISKEEITTIQDKLNHRPRKILNYRTPFEVFFTEVAKKLAA